MTETYSHDEFFERARRGEFVGVKVTQVQRVVLDPLTSSGYYDEEDEQDDVWSIGDGDNRIWEARRFPTLRSKRTYEVEL